MKYALLFAATAAAYEAYGGYNPQSSPIPGKVSSSVGMFSSAPVHGAYRDHFVTSSAVTSPSPVSEATPCSTSVGKNGYTTITAGYGKPPVTVTAQHQAYPTCVVHGYGDNGCDEWKDDKYVSTTITDYNKNVVTITKVQDYVTVYHENKTITHYATPTISGYDALSTGSSFKNATSNWYELYEKNHIVEYQNMGKHALVGYSGPGLCQKCDEAQEVVIREYKGGKWTEEKQTFNYGKPEDEVKVYEKLGVYTVPAKVVTVYTSTPTGKALEAGVYSYEAKVITITKPNQPYTCTYERPKQTPSNGKNHSVTATQTTTDNNDYGYKASATPKKPENDYLSYPSYPIKHNVTSYGNGYADKPTSTPCSVSSKPVYGDNGYAAKSTPTPAPSTKPAYGENVYGIQSTPILSSASKSFYGDNGYGANSTTTPSAYNNNLYSDNKPSSPALSKPSSTPCDENRKTPTPKPAKPVYDDSYKATPPPLAPSKPVYENKNNGYGDNNKPTPTLAKATYPADPSGGYGSATEYGKASTGYTKRGGMIERRNAVVEMQKARRTIVL